MLAGLVSTTGCAAPAMAGPGLHYSITALGDFFPTAINNRGQMVGSSDQGGESKGAIYSNGKLAVLNIPGGISRLHDINDSGQVVGTYGNTEIVRGRPGRGFVYSGGVFRDIGSGVIEASGINNAGTITGTMGAGAEGDTHAFIYAKGVLKDLNAGAPDGSTFSASDINGTGTVTGTSSIGPVGQPLPYIYSDGITTDLSVNVPGHVAGDEYQFSGTAINDADQVIFGRVSGPPDYSSYLYANGEVTDLGNIGTGTTVATGISNSGLIVGYGGDGVRPGSNAGFVWKDGQIFNVNMLVDADSGWFISSVQDVNDAGQLAASGCRGRADQFDPFTDCQGLLLTREIRSAVPEPGAYALLLAGLAMVGWRCRLTHRQG
jgi:probable HAF family extracellular repeat protein